MLATGLALALMAAAPEPAPPATAVVLARRTAVPTADAAELLGTVTSHLRQLGLPGQLDDAELALRLARLNLADATSCRGKPACVAELGRQLKVDWVVMVSVSQLGEERSLGLELLKVSTEAVVERDAMLLAAKGLPAAGVLETFASKAGAQLTPGRGLDAPGSVQLTPRGPGGAQPLALGGPAQRGHGASWVLGGSALVLVTAGALLLAIGLTARAQLDGREVDGRLRSPLTVAEAQGKATEASIEFGAAGACAAAGIALGTGAVLAW